MAVAVTGFEPVLDALSRGAQNYFGDAAAELEPFARLERPFSSLLRAGVRAGGRQFNVFLKIFKPRFGTPEEIAQLTRWVEREFRATATLHDAFTGRSGLAAVRPVAVFPERLALVTEEASGVPMDAVIRDAQWGRRVPAPLPDIAFRVGEWIRTYQDVTPAEGALSLDERRDYLDVRLVKLVSAGVIGERDRATALGRFDALRPSIDARSLEMVGIHADLCPPNILVDEAGGVTILDFAMAKTGARLHDLSHFYLHLEFQRWRPRLHRGMMEEAKRQLLAGYETGLTPRHPMFQLLLLQHVVCHAALLAEQAVGPLQPGRLWLARRRWQRCLRIDALDLAPPRAGAAQPS